MCLGFLIVHPSRESENKNSLQFEDLTTSDPLGWEDMNSRLP